MAKVNTKGERIEARLVLKAQLGDRQALGKLLERIQGRLMTFLCHRLGARADAEDCAQVVLIQICRRLTSLREPLAFRPWMFRIASNQATKLYRSNRRELELLDEDAALLTAPEPDAFPFEECLPTLHKRLEQLPANCSQVLFLHYMEGLSLLEISKVLDRPLGTIKSRLAYGLAKLRTQLKR